MKTDLTTPGSLQQSNNRASVASKTARELKDAKAVDPKLLPKTTSPDYKLDLSSAKAPASLPSPSLPSASAPSTPSVKLDKPDVRPEVKPEANDLIKEKAKQEIKTNTSMPIEMKDGSVKKASVIFIKGLDIFSSPSKSEGGYAGVGRMCESVEGARMYGWDQKSEIIKEISKVHPDYPVILVGHSLGGDTAVEIADAMDSLEHKFRPIDLLITIDAVGFYNDIIPQNVKNHLNVFGENDFFLNDGPHVARRNDMTKVKNILSPKDHTQLDDEKDIQYEVVNLIQKTLKGIS